MWQKNEVIRELQRQGKRITEQRKMIIEVILEGRWTNCKEVYFEASRRDKTVGLSTVYRTMRVLEEMGVLARGSQYTLSGKNEREARK